MANELKGLGRIPNFDPRSRDFQVRTLLRADGVTKPRSYRWKPGPVLNQGATGQCVGFSGAGELAARPVRWPADYDLGSLLYELCCRRDPWPQNDNLDRSFGTDVLTLMKVMRELKFIPAFHWCGAGSGNVVEDEALSVGYRGPAIRGTVWLNSMFDTASDGRIIVDPTSGEAGGHAYVIFGKSIVWKSTSLPASPTMAYVDRKKCKSWVVNSWGENGFGVAGIGYMNFDDDEYLLETGGESAIPEMRQRTT